MTFYEPDDHGTFTGLDAHLEAAYEDRFEYEDPNYDADHWEYGEYDSVQDAEDAYREFLNEIYPTVRFGELSYDPARVLEAVDPVAFQTGFNDWLDS